jgi:hypothetical protein
VSERQDIAAFVAERNAALLSLDEAKIRALCAKHGSPMPDDPEVFWRAVHKARVAVISFSDDVKNESRAWLKAHGSAPLDGW